VAPLARANDATCRHGVLVIYVKVAFRPGHPEVSERNKLFAPLVQSGAFSGSTSGIHPAIAPQVGDVEVVKSVWAPSRAVTRRWSCAARVSRRQS
jgi:hypothetical protein